MALPSRSSRAPKGAVAMGKSAKAMADDAVRKLASSG